MKPFGSSMTHVGPVKLILALLLTTQHMSSAFTFDVPRAQRQRRKFIHGGKPPVPEHPAKVKEAYASARESVSQNWEAMYHADLPCASATKAGFLSKAASIGDSATLRATPSQAQQYLTHGLPIYAGCQIYISHKWQFIFIRQPKSSSTAVLQQIKTNMCEDTNCTDHELLFTSQIDDVVWKSYFVFTFVRNPWARMLSAYDMMNKHFLFIRNGKDGKEKGPHCGLKFDSFTEDTYNMKKLCPAINCCPYVPPNIGFVPAFIDLHVNDQSHCVFTASGRSLADYIGRTENIDEDWPLVLAEINKRSGSRFQHRGPVKNPNGHGDEALGKVEHSCQDDKMRLAFNKSTMLNVAKQYAMDIKRYGYL